MHCFVIAVTLSFITLKVKGEMTITVPEENYFVQSRPISINCTSSIQIQNGVILYQLDTKNIVSLRYISPGQCRYLLSGETVSLPCNTTCTCDSSGRSTLYTYVYAGSNTSLTFSCTATSSTDKSRIVGTLVLEESHGPITIGVSPNQSRFFVNETDTLGPIACYAYCLPNCTFEWSGTETMIRNGILEIIGITKSNNGTFTCTAMNEFGRDTVKIEVIVQYGPQSISLEPSRNSYAIEVGKTLGPILCTSTCYPSCTLYWIGQGEIPPSNNLTITDMTKSDTGTYTCIASNEVGQLEKTINVLVQYGPEFVTINPMQIVYEVNETNRLGPIICSTDCIPRCSIQWNGPNTSIGNDTLLVYRTLKSHNGSYTCTATNVYGQAYVIVDVIVQYGPQDIALNPSPQTYIIEQGQMLGPILCTSSCNPTCDIKWMLQDIISPSNNLTVKDIAKNESGTFTCIASNVVGQLHRSIDVVVQYGPEVMTIYPQQDVVKVNETDQLGPINCTADCIPQCTFQWSGPNTSIGNRLLLVDKTEKSQNGTHTCIAENKYGEASVKLDVIVQYGPTQLTLLPNNKTFILLESQNFTIDCTADCNPKCNISWSGQVRQSNGNLKLANIQRNQTGNFTCEANNIVDSLSKKAEIIVHYAANVTSINISNLSEGLGYSKENETLDFICEADGLPKPKIRWFYTNISGITKIVSDNQLYNIQQTSCTHTGVYTCEVSNGFLQKVNRSRHVNITCPPTIREECSSPKKSAVKRNQTMFIVACLQSNPSPNVEWTKLEGNGSTNNTSVKNLIFINNTLIYTSMVEIVLMNEEELYLSMTAHNSFGKLTPILYHVIIADKPFEPRKVSVTCEKENIIQWYPNYDGGTDQTFDIKYVENNHTQILTRENLHDKGSTKRHIFRFTKLKPGTNYVFYVVATNELGSTVSNAVSCFTRKEVTRGGNSAPIIGGGTAAGCVILIIIIVVTVFIKRRRYQTALEKEKKLIKGDMPNNFEDDEDGLNDNPMYVSSDTAAIYSNVKIAEVKGNQSIDDITNTKYAETEKEEKKKKKDVKRKDRSKPIELGCVYENTEGIINIPEGPEYGNVDGKSTNSNDTYTPKKNKDGLLYADLEFSSASGEFVIRGLGNKSIYADIDLTKSAEPLPSDSDNDDKS